MQVKTIVRITNEQTIMELKTIKLLYQQIYEHKTQKFNKHAKNCKMPQRQQTKKSESINARIVQLCIKHVIINNEQRISPYTMTICLIQSPKKV